MNKKQQKIESLLFFKNEPVSFSSLSKYLNLDIEEVKRLISDMLSYYENRGISLIISDNKASLMTSDVSKEIIKDMEKEEDSKELSKQALETLSIILYMGAITKSELDYIRGVNSVFILRNLLIRGLIEKNVNKKDNRSILYSITHETLSFLGIRKKEDLPQYNFFKDKLEKIELEFKNEN